VSQFLTRLNESLAIVVQRIKASMAADACSDLALSDAENEQYLPMATDGLNHPASFGKVRVGFN